jgi:hypothetical protein
MALTSEAPPQWLHGSKGQDFKGKADSVLELPYCVCHQATLELPGTPIKLTPKIEVTDESPRRLSA